MAQALQWLRSLIFNILMYVMMLIMAVVFFPAALVSRNAAIYACHSYCRWVIWSAHHIVGLKTEVRGKPPTGEAIVAAKHQSFFDIIVIYGAMPRPRFIMKRELLFAPLLGQYAWRIGCVPVNRGAKGKAVAKMVRDVLAGRKHPGQLVIYPQGTRVAPGAKLPYKIGTAIIYSEVGSDCYPVATNIGVFWPKRGVTRKPGTAVVEFLDPIPAGVERQDFLALLEDKIESASNRLMAEAGFLG
jgi:1-acyl-sn-glycerol-3-phosphate acyltransferase